MVATSKHTALRGSFYFSFSQGRSGPQAGG